MKDQLLKSIYKNVPVLDNDKIFEVIFKEIKFDDFYSYGNMNEVQRQILLRLCRSVYEGKSVNSIDLETLGLSRVELKFFYQDAYIVHLAESFIEDQFEEYIKNTPEAQSLKGTPVKVTSGLFDGCNGKIVKLLPNSLWIEIQDGKHKVIENLKLDQFVVEEVPSVKLDLTPAPTKQDLLNKVIKFFDTITVDQLKQLRLTDAEIADFRGLFCYLIETNGFAEGPQKIKHLLDLNHQIQPLIRESIEKLNLLSDWSFQRNDTLMTLREDWMQQNNYKKLKEELKGKVVVYKDGDKTIQSQVSIVVNTGYCYLQNNKVCAIEDIAEIL